MGIVTDHFLVGGAREDLLAEKPKRKGPKKQNSHSFFLFVVASVLFLNLHC